MLIVHAYIEVTDAARGIAFYCEGLGLTLKRRLSPTWVELDGAGLPSSFSPIVPPSPTSAADRWRAATSGTGRRFILISSSAISTPRWRG